MEKRKTVKTSFILPEKVHNMLERLAEDEMMTKTCLIKRLVIDSYNRKYNKNNDDSR